MRYRKPLGLVLVIVAIIVGVWWWRWSAPYRTLTVFINALYSGDVKTLYALTPEHERRILNMELINRLYLQIIKPLLGDEFPQSSMTRVQRSSERPGIVNYLWPKLVIFYLWFKDHDKPFVVYTYLYRQQGWKVPFTYFVWLNAKGLYGDDTANFMMRRLGCLRVATPGGGTFVLTLRRW